MALRKQSKLSKFRFTFEYDKPLRTIKNEIKQRTQ